MVSFIQERKINYPKHVGERSQVVKALGCGSSIRGFDSRRSPLDYIKSMLVFTQFLRKHLNVLL